MWVAVGGSINPEGVWLYGPIGGSAPKYTVKNVMNPVAAILAGGMMLEFLSLTEASASIENAVQKAIKNDLASMEAGKMGMGTKEVGDLIAKYVAG
jgi:3-isopropylmalate dehydrogenase